MKLARMTNQFIVEKHKMVFIVIWAIRKLFVHKTEYVKEIILLELIFQVKFILLKLNLF